MNNGGIGGENRRFHGRTPCMGKPPMKRNLNDVSEIELNVVASRGLSESIERLLGCGFNFLDDADHLVNRRFIDQTKRPIDEQANVFVKLNLRRQLHWLIRVCF